MDIVKKLTAPSYWLSGSSEGHEGENDVPREAAAEILRLRAELAAARDAALEDADRVMADLCQTRGNVPMIAVELILAVRALKATPPTPLGPPT